MKFIYKPYNRLPKYLLLLSILLFEKGFSQSQSFECEFEFYNSSFVNVFEKINHNGYIIFQNGYGDVCTNCVPIHTLELNGNISSTKDLHVSSSDLFFTQVLKTPDGKYIATGRITGHNSILVKLDTSFNVLWSNYYSELQENIYSQNLFVAADSSFIMMGNTDLHNSFLAKFDKSGIGLWIRTFENFNTYDLIKKVVEDSDGNYYLLQGSNIFAQKYLLKINSSGNLIWSKKIRLINVALDQLIFDIEYDARKNEFLVSTNVSLIKIDTAGNVLWDKNYTPRIGNYNRLFISRDEIISIGNSDSLGICLNKYDLEGNPLLSKIYYWPHNGLDEVTSAMCRTSDSGFIVLALHDYPNHESLFFFKTDNLLNLQCHSNPSMQQISSSNQYISDTVNFIMHYQNIFSSQFNILSGTLNLPDSVTCSSISVNEIEKGNERLIIIPNPNRGNFKIRLPDSLLQENNATLIIYSAVGQEILKKNFHPTTFEREILVSVQSQGISALRITTGRLDYYSKIMIEY